MLSFPKRGSPALVRLSLKMSISFSKYTFTGTLGNEDECLLWGK
jgi:hypothetical protein